MTKVEMFIKIFAPILTLTGILVGVWQFNKGQEELQKRELVQRKFELKKMLIGNQFEALTKFKELQATKYKEATETISSIIYTDDYESEEFKESLKKFWQLYWVELAAVEDSLVEAKMVDLGNFMERLQAKKFKNITQREKTILYDHGLEVAHAIKESSKSWELPKDLRE